MGEPLLFFHSDTNPVLGHVLVYYVDKTHVLVVTLKLNWLLFLNILSFNFVPTPKKSLWLIRFRRSYVNHPTVVLIKVLLLFLAGCAVFKAATFVFFLLLFFPNDHEFAYPIFVENTCCSNAVSFKAGQQTKRSEIVIYKYIKTKSWS